MIGKRTLDSSIAYQLGYLGTGESEYRWQLIYQSHIWQEQVAEPRIKWNDAECTVSQETLPPLRHTVINKCSLLLR
jgi:hypothetical protein